MSERTRTLENAASRALLEAIRAPDDARAAQADNVIWRITESVIAKVGENLLGETEELRRILGAKHGETMCRAAHRIIGERNAYDKKYKKAKDAWARERVTHDTLRNVSQLVLGTEILWEHDNGCPGEACGKCRLREELEAALAGIDLEEGGG